MSTFLETIKQSYETGDLTDPIILKQAMMYENYQRCPECVQKKLVKLPEWMLLNPLHDTPAYKISTPPLKEQVSKGKSYTPTNNLHRVIKGHGVLRGTEITIKTQEVLKNPKLPAQERVNCFNDFILPILKNNKKWTSPAWIYMKDGKTEDNAVELLQDLGLYNIRTIGTGDSICYLSFEISECRKTHWVDADLAFYFHQTEDKAEHGWTRSLRTGELAYPELLHDEISKLKLLDVLFIDIDKTVSD